MKLSDAKALYALSRARHQEVVIHGVSVFDDGTALAPDAGLVLPVRSLLKPWQFLAADAFTEDALWAIGLSSHSGEPMHRRAMEALLSQNRLNEAALICPASQPMNAAEAQAAPSKRFHPCSGNHLSFLAACQKEGLGLNYGETDHPLQLRLKNLLKPRVQSWAMDSCGVPTAVMSVGDHMRLWRELAENEQNQRVVLLKKLWLKNPELTGGRQRLDTAIMLADRGNVLAKEGADGLLMVQSLPSPGQVPQGCFIKISSGYQAAHLALALWAKLTKERAKLNASFQLIYQYLDQHKQRWCPYDQELVLD